MPREQSERKFSPPGSSLVRLGWNLHGDPTVNRIKRSSEPGDPRAALAVQLLDANPKSTLSTAAVLSLPRRRISSQELVGTALFIGGITELDDLLDGDYGSEGKLAQVPEHRIRATRVAGTEITFDKLFDATLESFSGNPDKQDAIGTFLEDVFVLHEARNLYEPGTYDAREAFDYRERTSVPMVEIGGQLVGLLPRYDRAIRPLSTALQMWDDGGDYPKDMSQYSANMAVGLATSLGELSSVQDALAQGASAKEGWNAMPKTRHFYRAAYRNVTEQVGLPVYQGILSVMGRRTF